MKATAVFLAGIANSGPGHWQRLWHERLPGSLWVEHTDWDWPSAKTWLADLERSLAKTPEPRIAIAHSLGCLLLGQWLSGRPRAGFKAVLLVAPPDVGQPDFPDGLGFTPGWSHGPLRAAGLCVASRNDPYGSLEHARRCARAWGIGLMDAGAKGHLNAESGLENWEEGWKRLELLLKENGLEL